MPAPRTIIANAVGYRDGTAMSPAMPECGRMSQQGRRSNAAHTARPAPGFCHVSAGFRTRFNKNRYREARRAVAIRNLSSGRSRVAIMDCFVATLLAMTEKNRPEFGALAEAIESRLNTGRPLAARDWIKQQEAATGRALAPRKLGPKPKGRGVGENGRMNQVCCPRNCPGQGRRSRAPLKIA